MVVLSQHPTFNKHNTKTVIERTKGNKTTERVFTIAKKNTHKNVSNQLQHCTPVAFFCVRALLIVNNKFSFFLPWCIWAHATNEGMAKQNAMIPFVPLVLPGKA
jgi:hypothetical protein